MFEGEAPDNYEQKCLCLLVIDVSGSMAGRPVEQLNQGLQEFQREVLDDFVASQKLEVGIITFSSDVRLLQEPSLITQFQMPALTTSGTTRLADAVTLAIDTVEARKRWYKETGQNYYRPLIVLITDGEPDLDQDIPGLIREVHGGVTNKKFTFYALGVQGFNRFKLTAICPPGMPPAPLDGYKFSAFFKWLSNSIGIITKSKDGDMAVLPSTEGWAQVEL